VQFSCILSVLSGARYCICIRLYLFDVLPFPTAPDSTGSANFPTPRPLWLFQLTDLATSNPFSCSRFSPQSALRIYGQYLNLDTDHNGMLSRQELASYGAGTLTDVFLDRVFQARRN
jgi:hypothetical protein